MLIASPLFLKRNPLTKATLSSLHVRGSGVQVDDALSRKGWEGEEAIIAAVITSDPVSGNIKGSRYETHGALANEVQFKAKDLWSIAKQGVEVSLRFDDLSILKWATEGDVRNLSAWVQDKEVNVTITKDDKEIQIADKAKHGVGDFVIRFLVLPVSVDQSLLYAGILPFSKETLEDKLKACGRSLESTTIPTVPLKLYKSNGKWTNGHPIKLFPNELPGDKFGLCVLPLLKIVGAGKPTFPDHNKIEQELAAFLRGTVAPTTPPCPRSSLSSPPRTPSPPTPAARCPGTGLSTGAPSGRGRTLRRLQVGASLFSDLSTSGRPVYLLG